jgi:hypothetical protein
VSCFQNINRYTKNDAIQMNGVVFLFLRSFRNSSGSVNSDEHFASSTLLCFPREKLSQRVYSTSTEVTRGSRPIHIGVKMNHKTVPPRAIHFMVSWPMIE